MIWTAQKKALEEKLADVLQGHIQYHVTRYGRRFSHSLTRAWITFDKEELVSFSTIGWWMEHWKLRKDLQKINNATDYRDPRQQDLYQLSHVQATNILHKKELFTRDDFDSAVQEYLNLSIENALQSENPLIRIFSMLDYRLGKRRLSTLEFRPTETQLVKRFYALRCKAENLKSAYPLQNIL